MDASFLPATNRIFELDPCTSLATAAVAKPKRQSREAAAGPEHLLQYKKNGQETASFSLVAELIVNYVFMGCMPTSFFVLNLFSI